MAQEITIDIDVNGDVKVEGRGIVGADCVTLTKDLELALGNVKKKTLKPDYRRRPEVLRKQGV